MTSADMEHRVNRLENDVHAIYDMLGSIQSVQESHTTQLGEIGSDVTGLKTQVNGLSQRLDGHDKRFDAHDKRFDAHDKRFDRLDAKMDTVLELLQR